jgi:ABC-type polar amino acid transport system ATPase subunit
MLSVDNLQKSYENGQGVNKADFQLNSGEVAAIIGPSGSGKSTLLKLIAGILRPDAGKAQFDSDEHAYAYVGQEYTLWPHLTVVDNLTLAPNLRKQHSKKDLLIKAKELLQRFGMEGELEKYPHELSGGQRQRVSLLRAIMTEPRVLLLDEVTSALDPELTKSVLDLVRALAKDGYTMLIVTHHMSFAMSVASRVLFMKDGDIVQDRSSVEFFSAQEDPSIRRFMLDIARKDDQIEIFKGIEQYQAYHLNLIRHLAPDSTIYVAGSVGDEWYKPMGKFYEEYERIRHERNITWKMTAYDVSERDIRLLAEYPNQNNFRKMPRQITNPANYNVFDDVVITQIFGDEPTIVQIKNKDMAKAYLAFFEDLWSRSQELVIDE